MLQAMKGKQSTVKNIVKNESSLLLETENGILNIEPYSDSIIRVRYTQSDNFSDIKGIGLDSVLPDCNWSYKEDKKELNISTKNILLKIDKQTCAFSYYDKNKKLLLKEPSRGGKILEQFDSYKTILDDASKTEKISTADGIKEVVLESKKIFNKSLYHTKMEFEWAEDEAIYGFGQQQEGSLNLRGTRQYIHQANMKIAIPFFLSTKGYGILIDTYSPLIFNDNEYGSYIYNEAANELDFYFIYGDSFDEIISGYRIMTGKAAMLPLWAFGYMQSQERYETQEEILHIVSEYRKRNIPIDSIVLDWLSWEDEHWGQKSFDKNRFPDVPSMMEKLHASGVHFMMSIWPNMNEKTQNYVEMKEKGCLLQKSELYNAFSEEARKLYWKQAYEGLFSKGIDAWWCDSSEAFTPEWNSSFKPEPDSNYKNFHETARMYMDEEYTNAFSLMHAKAMYDGQRSTTSEKRVVNLTRSGYTGQQKYGTILWSGDISANWQTLRNQISAGLSLCASGMPYWTLDIGAFFVKQGNTWFWNGDYEDGCKDLGYRELYTRWLQLGAFLPVFRSHGTDTRREIWAFGDEGELFYDTLVKYIELRYQLMPYIYSLSAMVYRKDYTILRLLTFDFKNDTNVYDIKDQFMFGNAFMVCPVTEPMYYGPDSTPLNNTNKTRQVYLPKDSVWYDFWTNKKYEGGQTITVNAEIEKLPLMVRAGSIIPIADSSQHTNAITQDHFTLKVYSGYDGEFTLYQDERDNYNYENGRYSLIDLRWDDASGELNIGDRIGTYDGMPDQVGFNIEIIGR